MKKSGRELQDCTNQIGRGNGQEQQTFEIVRAPEDNHFQIEVRDSKSCNMLQGKLHTKQD